MKHVEVCGVFLEGGRPAATFLAALLLVAPVPVAAAAAESTSGQIEEIVVTAQFRRQNLQDTPVAITAISADMLEARSQTSIVSIADQAPNVTLKPAPAPYGPALQAFIRGVGQSDFSYALEPGVGMYVDDVYFSTTTGSIFDLLDLERVEVLRGPQGTLAGQNSIGGAIKLYSHKPDGEGRNYIQVTYGDYDRTDIRAGADFTLVPERAFARIAGVSHHQDGYVTRYDYGCTHPGSGVPSSVNGDSCKLGTEGGKAYEAVRGALRLLPSEKLELNFSADYTHDRSEASPFTLLYVGHVARGSVPEGPGINPVTRTGAIDYRGLTTNNQADGVPMGTGSGSAFISDSPFGDWAQDTFSDSPYINYSNYTDPDPVSGSAGFTAPPVYRVGGWGVAATADYWFSDTLSLKSITAYREYDGDWSIDEDATPIADATLHNTVWHRQFSEELRLSGRAFGAVDWTVGAFYFDQKSHYGGRIDLALSGLDFIESDDIPGETRAAFAHADWAVTGRLNLIAGVRYTEQEKTFVFGRLGVPGNATWGGGAPPAVAGLNGIEGRFEGDEVDYRVAVQYRWSDAFMTYAQVATGFKGGGINPRPFYPQQALPFGPETLTAYEVGVKTDLLDHRLRLNAAAFFNQYEDIVLTVNFCPIPGAPAPVPCARPVNAGEAEFRGLELELEVRPTERLSIDASASLLDFEYESISTAALGSGISVDMESPFSPERKYSAGIQYDFPLGDAGTLTQRLDWSYQSDMYTQAVNSEFNHIDGYGVTNARLSWRSANEEWDVSVEVTNLADKLYYLSYFDNRGSTQNVLGQPAPPRQWAVSIRRSF